MDECLEHVETPDCTDAGTVQLRLPESAPIPEHGQKDAPGVRLVVG